MTVRIDYSTQPKHSNNGLIIALAVAYVAVLLMAVGIMQQNHALEALESTPGVHPSSSNNGLLSMTALLQEEQAQTVKNDKNFSVKGIYISSWIAGSPGLFNERLKLVEETAANAMVIDIKDAKGKMTYRPDEETMAFQLGLYQERIRNLGGIVQTLDEKNIYSIARLVVAKDPELVHKRPEWFLHDINGNIWRDYGNKTWLNPYNKAWWDYIIEISIDAAELGFDEIQYDYIRFPTDGATKQIQHPQNGMKARSEAIAGFLAYARERLRPYQVTISADVYGLVTSAVDDVGIGQHLETIVQNVDYICPMIYPSHYYSGSFGLDNPNAYPYEVIYRALSDAKRRLEGQEDIAVMRPWLQDFNMGTPRYGKDEILAQIKAVEDAGYEEWLLWDPANTYNRAALEALNH